jgi:hypothetical protein
VQNLQSKPTTINDRADVAVVKQELQALNEKFTQSESNRAEWEKLGRVSDPYACTEPAGEFISNPLLESYGPVPGHVTKV